MQVPGELAQRAAGHMLMVESYGEAVDAFFFFSFSLLFVFCTFPAASNLLTNMDASSLLLLSQIVPYSPVSITLHLQPWVALKKIKIHCTWCIGLKCLPS